MEVTEHETDGVNIQEFELWLATLGKFQDIKVGDFGIHLNRLILPTPTILGIVANKFLNQMTWSFG